MGENALKERWRQGKAAVNGWLAIPSAFSAEVMASCGWNSVTVDLQHGVQDYLSMIACFQALQAHPVTRLVRVPVNEPSIIGKALDGGAYGVICPLVNTAAEAAALVAACKYPPRGSRSNGPVRAAIYAGATYQQTANDEILVIPMIETRQALDNLDAILDVPGIDAIYVGPSDLGLSLGLVPRLDREEPEVLAIYERLLRETGRRGIKAGIHCGGADYAVRMLRLGFRLVTIANDSGLMAKAARQAIGDVWKEAGDLR
jgi:4-hydroxy-2-oxoheptanedioate aldolase